MSDEPEPLGFGALLRCHRAAAGLAPEGLAARAHRTARGVSALIAALGEPSDA